MSCRQSTFWLTTLSSTTRMCKGVGKTGMLCGLSLAKSPSIAPVAILMKNRKAAGKRDH